MTAIEILDFEKVNLTEKAKVQEIVDSIKANGWQGAPILVYGNTLITGSHRLAALQALYNEDYDISKLDVAVDVSDIIEDKLDEGVDVYGNLDYLREIFEGTWAEDYAKASEEW